MSAIDKIEFIAKAKKTDFSLDCFLFQLQVPQSMRQELLIE